MNWLLKLADIYWIGRTCKKRQVKVIFAVEFFFIFFFFNIG